jgi:predicted nucleic acid-binding protein
LALAQILEVPLVTVDARLRRGAGHIVAMPTLAEISESVT